MNLPLIQDPILAKRIPKSYILSSPKDGKIGGDGFWIHEKGDTLFISVFDCTGQGNLAKLTTRIYINALEKVVANVGIDYTGSILQYIHREIQSRFDQKKDIQLSTGADLAIIKIDRTNRTLEYAGAKIDLVIVENDSLSIIKSDRMQVGEMFDFKHVYNSNVIDLKDKREAIFFLATDGFKNQIGSASKRKIGKTDFLKLLEEKAGLPIKDQPRALMKYLKKWQGDAMRSDDILIVGLKI